MDGRAFMGSSSAARTNDAPRRRGGRRCHRRCPSHPLPAAVRGVDATHLGDADATDADDATTIEIDAADIALSSDDGLTRADV